MKDGLGNTTVTTEWEREFHDRRNNFSVKIISDFDLHRIDSNLEQGKMNNIIVSICQR